MPRLSRRAKIISIRVSGEEYEQLQNLCVSRGADSISELARRAMRLFMRQESVDGNSATIESRFNDVYVRMSTLDREIARLSELISASRLENEPRPQGNGSVARGNL